MVCIPVPTSTFQVLGVKSRLEFRIKTIKPPFVYDSFSKHDASEDKFTESETEENNSVPGRPPAPIPYHTIPYHTIPYPCTHLPSRLPARQPCANHAPRTCMPFHVQRVACRLYYVRLCCAAVVSAAVLSAAVLSAAVLCGCAVRLCSFDNRSHNAAAHMHLHMNMHTSPIV